MEAAKKVPPLVARTLKGGGDEGWTPKEKYLETKIDNNTYLTLMFYYSVQLCCRYAKS